MRKAKLFLAYIFAMLFAPQEVTKIVNEARTVEDADEQVLSLFGSRK